MDLTVTLTGANGDTLTFDTDNYVLATGLKGFGVPSTSLRIDNSASDGGVFRYTKRGVREVDLPVVVLGSSRADTETKLRRLAKVLRSVDGPARLTVTYATGAAYYLDVYYAGGADATFGGEANESFCRWVITVQAPKPYWTSTAAQTFSVQQANAGRGLLPRLANLRLTGSQAVGTVTVNNTDGDVPSYPVFTVYGPLTNLTVSSGSKTFTYTQPIAAGEVITINTAARTVVDAAGANRYSGLGSAPKFFAIPPGTSSVAIYGDGATAATQVACTYYPSREVLF